MSTQQGAFVDRVYVGWAHMEARLAGGSILVGITAVEGGDSVEDELIYGAGRAPIGRGRGDYKPDNLKIKMLQESWEELMTELTKDGSSLYQHKPFDFVLTYTPEPSAADPSPAVRTRTYKSNTLLKAPDSIARGDKKQELDVEFLTMMLKRNNINPIPLGKK